MGEDVATVRMIDEPHDMSDPELANQLRTGLPVRIDQIVGWQYRGTSLGLPSWIERLTWKQFIKVFHKDDHGRARGWNVRCHQFRAGFARGKPASDMGASAPGKWTPKVVRSVPVTFGHFAIVEATARYALPPGALLLDYGAGGNGVSATVLLRDPLVALDDRADRLLGCSLVELAGRLVPTPSYFLLERFHPVEHVPYPPRDGG